MLFNDRLEIWNPGTLPPTLTLSNLREPHGSFPRNPLLAESLSLAKYIERIGESKLNLWEDGMKNLIFLFKKRFSRV